VSIPIKEVNVAESSWFWGFIPAIRFSAGGKSYLFTLLRHPKALLRAIQEAKQEFPTIKD
jgi:hypothetical protein